MIVDKESNDVGAPDLNSQILKLKNSGADTFFVFETPSPAIKALVSAFQAGWHPTIYLNSVAAPVPYVQAAQKAAGDAAAVNGIVTVQYLKDSADPAQANDAGIQMYKPDHDQVLPGREARRRLQRVRHGHRLEPGRRAQESWTQPDPPGSAGPAEQPERDRKPVHVSGHPDQELSHRPLQHYPGVHLQSTTRRRTTSSRSARRSTFAGRSSSPEWRLPHDAPSMELQHSRCVRRRRGGAWTASRSTSPAARSWV